MIDHAVRYLKGHSATFRVVSYPMSEPLPAIAQRPPTNGQLVDTHVVLVDAAPVLACVPAGEPLDIVSLAQEIQGIVMEGRAEDLPAPFGGLEYVPPLGGLVGVPVFVDSRVVPGVIVFRAFGKEDFIEVLFDDYARIEQPRVVAIAVAGALPQTASGGEAPPPRAERRPSAHPQRVPAHAKQASTHAKRGPVKAAPKARAARASSRAHGTR